MINVLFLVNYDQLVHSFAGPVLPLYEWSVCVLYCLAFLTNKTKQNIMLLKNTSIPRAEHKCYIGINLLAFYHECCSLIGYATHYLFCYR